MASYFETLERIFNLRGGEIDLRLDRMDRALALFGHPEKKFPSFHIAGTNGKGSTAAMLHRVLSLAGYRTGLYTSPHLVSFTERIRIDDSEISPEQVTALAEEIQNRISAAGISLTFFEYITVMAFMYFERQRIDVAVVEVGLGGRLDATNLVRPVVSLITTISRDHEAYLGNDLLSIAREKGGIIKNGVPVAIGAVTAPVAAVFEAISAERGAPRYFLGRDYKISLKNETNFDYTGIKRHYGSFQTALPGRHQIRNAAVALAALDLASEIFPVAEQVAREGLRTVSWPGRFEVIRDCPTVILDGAHNGEGAGALAETVAEYCGGRKVKLLFASMQDKDWRLMLGVLSNYASEITFTRVAMERSADPHLMAAEIKSIPCRVIEDARQALAFLIEHAACDDIILTCGSLYLLGEVRSAVAATADNA